MAGFSLAAPIGQAASLCEHINDAVYAPPGQTLSAFVEVALSHDRLMLSVGAAHSVFVAKVPDPPAGPGSQSRCLQLLPRRATARPTRWGESGRRV